MKFTRTIVAGLYVTSPAKSSLAVVTFAWANGGVGIHFIIMIFLHFINCFINFFTYIFTFIFTNLINFVASVCIGVT